MVFTEYLAISAIFMTGLLLGLKIQKALFNLKNYLAEKNKIQ